MPDIVIKLGGSLLENPDLTLKLRALIDRCSVWNDLKSNPQPRIWIVVGGGVLVNAIRHLDQIHHLAKHQLDQRKVHDWAIDAMSLTAGLVADLTQLPLAKLPKSGIPEFLSLWNTQHPGQCAVVDVAAPVKADTRIPANWDVTSDSLALWFCQQIKAKRLILAKSVAPLEARMKISKIQELGWIDPHFSVLFHSAGITDFQTQLAHLGHGKIVFTSIQY